MFPGTKPRTYFSAQGPALGTPFRFSLPSTGSCQDQFPGFISTMKVLRLPAARPTALRFLRLVVRGLRSTRCGCAQEAAFDRPE